MKSFKECLVNPFCKFENKVNHLVYQTIFILLKRKSFIFSSFFVQLIFILNYVEYTLG